MELKRAWIVFECRENYNESMTISWEILDADGMVAISGTAPIPRETQHTRASRTNARPGIQLEVEDVTPANIRIGVDSGSEGLPYYPLRFFVLGADDDGGPLVMASVLDWPSSDPLVMGMNMVYLSSVGGVTPDSGHCPPESDDSPSSPGAPGKPTIHPRAD